LTAGLAAMVLAALLWLVDDKGSSWWTQPFRVFGMNAILAYLCEEVVGSVFYNASIVPIGGEWVDLATTLYRHVMLALLPPKQASLAFALAVVAFWYAVLHQFHRRGVFLKV
jgi:predicted acyltransferase